MDNKLKRLNNYYHKKWDESLLKGKPDFTHYQKHRYYERLQNEVSIDDPIYRRSKRHLFFLANQDTNKIKSQFKG